MDVFRNQLGISPLLFPASTSRGFPWLGLSLRSGLQELVIFLSVVLKQLLQTDALLEGSLIFSV